MNIFKGFSIKRISRVVAMPRIVETVTAHEVHEYVKTIPVRNKGIAESVEKQKVNAATTKLSIEEIGFNNTKEVLEISKLSKEKKRAMEYVEACQSLLDAFPWSIYLLKKDITEICDKYDLWHGDASAFIDSIPVKNMMEINNRGKKLMKYFDCDSHNLEYSVIAPQKMFTIDKDHEAKGRRIKKKVITVDPIVLVKFPFMQDYSEYVVISMWGPEAELPEVKR